MLLSFWKKVITFICLSLLAAAIGGCGKAGKYTPVQYFCGAHDWYKDGFVDGNKGKELSSLARSKSFCYRFGMTVNTWEYDRGWRAGIRDFCLPQTALQMGRHGKPLVEYCPRDLKPAFKRAWHRGIRQFCTGENGFNLGRSGENFNPICPADLEPAFRAGYESGRDIYLQILRLERRLVQINDELALLNEEMKRLPLDAPCERIALQERINKLYAKRRKILKELARLKAIRYHHPGSFKYYK